MESTAGTRTLLSDPKIAIPAMTMPLAVAILIQNVNSMTDIMWASWLGAAAVGGMGLAYPLYASVCGVGSGLAIGASSSIARHVGMRDREGATRAAGQSLFVMIAFSVLISVVFVLLTPPLMHAFGDPAAAEGAIAYGMPMFAGSFFLISSSMLSGILRGEGAAKASMLIQVIGALSNMVLDPVLMYGAGMGVAGAGWATTIAGGVSLALGLYCYTGKHKMYVSLRVRDLKPDAKLSWDILRVGLPQSAEYVTMSVINIPMNYIIVGVGGADAVGVYTSAWRVAYIVLVPAQAYSGAVVSVCSAEYAQGRADLVKEAYRFAVKKSLYHTALTSAAMMLLSYPLAMLFTQAEDLHYLRTETMIIFLCLGACMPMMAQVFVGSSFLQALKHSEIGFLSSLIRNIVMVTGYASVAVIFHVVTGIWIIMAVIEIFGGALMAWLAWRYILAFERQCSSGKAPEV